jgi:uncharacterized protein YndB with AHSA1/START domain
MPSGTRHDTFTLTRIFDAQAPAVFALFADTEKWRRWFRMPGIDAAYDHNFRVGAGDRATSRFVLPDGRVEELENRSVYFHIEPERRIVYAYESIVNRLPRWASLVTVELTPQGGGTQLSWTEQVAFVTPSGDGIDDLPHLRGAIRLLFNALSAALTP